MAEEQIPIRLKVNGLERERTVEPRRLLADFLRHDLRLTGTHIGCAHGVCGACTILIDGEPARSCLMFAAQADACDITTVEGLAPADVPLPPLHQAFHERHALQCGFCTPGMLIGATHLLASNPDPDADAVRAALGGNLCRCTGYAGIVAAVLDAAQVMRKRGGT